jgi:hypothetical protein
MVKKINLIIDKSLSGDFGKMYPSPSPSPTVFPPTSPKDQGNLVSITKSN